MTYDITKTTGSMLLAVIVVGAGLVIAGYGKGGWARIITGGTIIGAGVAAMHYMGMDGMVMPDMVSYNPVLVGLSIIIAVVAGTAALWAGSNVRTMRGSIGASMILGVAVVGMHYTGMWAMNVSVSQMPMASGATAFTFVVPVVVGLTVITFGITMALLLGRSEDEIAEDVVLDQRAAALAAGRPGGGTGAQVTFTGPMPAATASSPTTPGTGSPRSSSGRASAAGSSAGWGGQGGPQRSRQDRVAQRMPSFQAREAREVPMQQSGSPSGPWFRPGGPDGAQAVAPGSVPDFSGPMQ
jgi:hypothetical protein